MSLITASMNTMTLNRYIQREARKHPHSRGELSELLSSIATGAKLINSAVESAAFTNSLGEDGAINVQGERVQKLDILANEILENLLGSLGHFGLLASEETDEVIPTEAATEKSAYVVAFDPLDGSSNIGVNVSVGTIFGIFRKKSASSGMATQDDFFQSGRSLVAAGYALYGSSTVFVYSCGKGVHEFTLDRASGEFLLTDPDIRMPENGSIYSVNEGNYANWDQVTRRYVDAFKFARDGIKSAASARYIGSLVADFHRNLKKGGVFIYPADAKNSSGKLRLLYECMPVAFIAEQAGGRAIDGTKDVLDLVPSSIHQRCPLYIGSKSQIEFFESLRDG